jgi:hypothetical protein
MAQYWICVETSKWQESTQANHVYVFTEQPKGRSAKCIGYVQKGTKNLIKFKNPISLDLKGRTFAELT